MTEREERLAALVRRGQGERESLAEAAAAIRHEIERRRSQWKAASLIATGLATAGTVAYKLFGRTSPSAQIGRAASAVSLLVGLARGFQRVRRFW